MKKFLLVLTVIVCLFTACAPSKEPPLAGSYTISFDRYPFSHSSSSVLRPSYSEDGDSSSVRPDLSDREWEDAPIPQEDPYEGMTKAEFYRDYEPATSAEDALFRSEHGFMSGEIEVPDQAPILANYQPKTQGKLARNTSTTFSEDGKTYYITDGDGNIVNRIFYGGGYITLEEVAAYVFAFGEIPANYSSSKKTSPTSSIWGEYLRVNFSKFSGNTTKYPYEPELPFISGNGGSLTYYEMDIGTTGTDCDPSYVAKIYNNGVSITRGAARIVFSVNDGSSFINDPNRRYVFYTYNHYNDFQEYLNYEGGWGEIFGNITGGGTLSSKTHYNPTSYVEVGRVNFRSSVLLSALNEYLGTPVFGSL